MTVREKVRKCEKVYMGNKDIQELFGCGRNKASDVIRSVKIVTNSLPFLAGKVACVDFLRWYEEFGAKVVEGGRRESEKN